MRTLLLAASLVAAGALAGCADTLSFASDDAIDGSFSITPATGDKDTVFRVRAAASLHDRNLTWDWGDGTLSYGPEAEHRYNFSNGVMTVTLIATAPGGVPEVASKTVTLGSGVNKLPTARLSATRTWVEVGRPVNLSATATDADRDPLTYLWTYKVLSTSGGSGDGHDGHSHGGGGAPVEGEEILIDGTERRASVSFDAPGQYEVTVRVKDPKGGEAVDNKTVMVSRHIPATQLHIPFTGKLLVGTAGAGASEKLWTDGVPDTFADVARHPFELKYPATAYMFLRWNDSTNQSVFDLDLELRNADTGETVARSETHAVNTSAPAPPMPLPPVEFTYGDLPAGNYLVIVRGHVGAQVDYAVDVFATLRITPELVAAVEGA